ncbi:MAG TPA: hypothetical protein VM843_06785 [Flavisolibacter sp.]|nr:hypothetical protein [Flavisolibacter sp.]
MRYLLSMLCACVMLFSCKETIEDAKEDAVIKIMVSGQWTVTAYTRGTTSETAQFSSYRFQFYENGTVAALKNGTTEKTGTWVGNTSDLSITSNFTTTTPPLALLNGRFQITNSGQTFVEAKMTVNGELHQLRLDK